MNMHSPCHNTPVPLYLCETSVGTATVTASLLLQLSLFSFSVSFSYRPANLFASQPTKQCTVAGSLKNIILVAEKIGKFRP